MEISWLQYFWVMFWIVVMLRLGKSDIFVDKNQFFGTWYQKLGFQIMIAFFVAFFILSVISPESFHFDLDF